MNAKAQPTAAEEIHDFIDAIRDQPANLGMRLRNILRLEERFAEGTNFGENVNKNEIALLIREWTHYLAMPPQPDERHRYELAYLHILALGDFLEGKIPYSKCHGALYGKLPNLVRNDEDLRRTKKHIENYGRDTIIDH